MLNNMEEIGKRIKACREEKGIKQQVLASKAKMDVASLSRYENGKQTPNLESFVSIAQVLNVSTDYLLFGNEKKTISSEERDDDVYFSSKHFLNCLATCIEYGLIAINGNSKREGALIINLKENKYLYEFFDRITSLSDLSSSMGFNNYCDTRDALIDEYAKKYQNLEYELRENMYQYPDYALFDNNEEECKRVMNKLYKKYALK